MKIIDNFETQLYNKELAKQNLHKKRNERKQCIDNPNKYFNEEELVCGKKIKIYEINDIPHLIQFVGYCKYLNREWRVLLRGQSILYMHDNKIVMTPSLYREIIENETVDYNAKYQKHINIVKRNKTKSLDYDIDILDPLLQHYGLKTNQIDVVDNLWVSLWFASHYCDSAVVNSHEYIKYCQSSNEYGYLFLLASDANINGSDGIYRGDMTTLVDLRKAVPSAFIRPHAQHAFMLTKNNKCESDYTDLIVGIVKIKTANILRWIGNSDLLAVENLFPSPIYDDGYATLLNKFKIEDGEIGRYGSIQIIT